MAGWLSARLGAALACSKRIPFAARNMLLGAAILADPAAHPPPESSLNLTVQVGYVSPDLFTHSVSYFAEAPLAHHDSTRVKHIVYSCVPKVRRCHLG
jgi:hypothetical protein